MARPLLTAAVLIAGLALLLGVVALALGDDTPGTNVLSWVLVGLFGFDAVVVWVFPDLARAGPPQVALPVTLFAVAPALTAYSTVFLGQPRWVYAAGFAVSATLVVTSIHRLRWSGRGGAPA